VNPESYAPRPKVVAGGIAGAASILVVYVASLFGLDVPPEVASAFTVVVSFGASYIKKP
jgi:hypothetical protein